MYARLSIVYKMQKPLPFEGKGFCNKPHWTLC